MKKATIKAFAKINLSLDVNGIMDNGFHRVEMVMQQTALCDDVLVRWYEGQRGIELSTNRYFLPTDSRNLAYKAAMLMQENFDPSGSGKIRIDIKKRIPVAAGLAGGSSNGAAVLHALNLLWGLELSLAQLCSLGAELGSDVPFCVMGQAASDKNLRTIFRKDPLAYTCALATGRGTDLTPLPPLKSHLVLSKPPVNVSTAEVYKGIDHVHIPERPDTYQLCEALRKNDAAAVEKNMINVLENFTLKRYPNVVYTKNKMQDLCKPHRVLMSGSGPTVFGLCDTMEDARRICGIMSRCNRESFWTKTTW